MLFERQQKGIRRILNALEIHPRKWKELAGIWVSEDSTYDMFAKVIKWLRSKGYIKKRDRANRFSPYEITEAGKKYLEGLKA